MRRVVVNWGVLLENEPRIARMTRIRENEDALSLYYQGRGVKVLVGFSKNLGIFLKKFFGSQPLASNPRPQLLHHDRHVHVGFEVFFGAGDRFDGVGGAIG